MIGYSGIYSPNNKKNQESIAIRLVYSQNSENRESRNYKCMAFSGFSLPNCDLCPSPMIKYSFFKIEYLNSPDSLYFPLVLCYLYRILFRIISNTLLAGNHSFSTLQQCFSHSCALLSKKSVYGHDYSKLLLSSHLSFLVYRH